MSEPVSSNSTAAGSTAGQAPSTAATGRLAVNAAFLKEIKDDNRQLKNLWDHLVPMMSQRELALNHWNELEEDLAKLRDQLALHFSLEEAYGYFDEAVDIAPHMSISAETLKSEHTKLFARIRDLADEIVDINRDQDAKVDAFLKNCNRFRIEFQRHEEAELQLILDSFDDDIGVGD